MEDRTDHGAVTGVYNETFIGRRTLERLLFELAPIRIHLTETDEDSRWVELDDPHTIDLVAGEGIRIGCAGRVRYTALGLSFPLSIRNVQVLLSPKVVVSAGSHKLAFHVVIEQADLKNIPDMIDRSIVRKVNDALAPTDTQMVWDFGTTLTKTVSMPERFEPLDALEMKVTGGDAQVLAEGIRFRVYFDARITRKKAQPSDD